MYELVLQVGPQFVRRKSLEIEILAVPIDIFDMVMYEKVLQIGLQFVRTNITKSHVILHRDRLVFDSNFSEKVAEISRLANLLHAPFFQNMVCNQRGSIILFHCQSWIHRQQSFQLQQ